MPYPIRYPSSATDPSLTTYLATPGAQISDVAHSIDNGWQDNLYVISEGQPSVVAELHTLLLPHDTLFPSITIIPD